MIVIGLTGSIGMGKSTCGALLSQCGVPVHEADHAVHQILAHDKKAITEILSAFPSLSAPLDRQALGKLVFADDEKRKALENILHPRVQTSQNAFIKAQRAKGNQIVALDIPLLFETGAQTRVDYTALASAPFHLQAARVLKRPGMSEEKFFQILNSQMPDHEKRSRADFILPTGLGKAYTMKAVKKMLTAITVKERDYARNRA